MTSVINFINTGTGANAGNGDSLRTAFNKINQNFVDLENSYVQSGVASFNGTGGVITFTATDITNLLGFIPYNSGNPSQYVTQSSVDGLASLLYLDSNFVTTSTILNYTTKNYVDTNLAQYATLDFLSAQNYISNVTLPNFLTFYATEAWVGLNFISTASIGTYLNQGKVDLLPVIANTYDIGSQLLPWKTLYLSDSIYIDNYVITVNTVTNKLTVNNQGLTGNYSFDPQNIYNNDVSFDINASYNPLISPVAVAGIHFPNNTQASLSSIRVYNTATGGVVLDGKTTQVLVDEGNIAGVEVRGRIKLPVSFKDGNNTSSHILTISPNLLGTNAFGGLEPDFDRPVTISVTGNNSVTPADLYMTGRIVGLRANTNPAIDQVNQIVVGESGVFIGTTNTGYVLPGAIGGTGTTLISDGQGLVSWSTQTFGSTSINSQNAVFTTATITKRFRLGTEGLTFYDGSNMITAYGNQQVSDFLPQYTGALSVGYIAGLGTSVSLISNGLTWAFSATGVLSLPSGGQIGELYGNGVDIRANPAGYIKLVSNSGNNYLKIDNLGAYVFATNNQWAFGTDGKLTLPAGGDIVDSTGASVLGGTGDGYTGSSGFIGSQGPAGPAGGYTGSVGYIGSQGITGFSGSQGVIGYTGSSGFVGSVGYTGSPGVDALWNFRGAYSGGLDYTLGDVITLDGSTYYSNQLNFASYGPYVTPAGWDLIAAKGDFGYTGSQSDVGFTGSQSYTGSQGDIGYTGSGGGGTALGDRLTAGSSSVVLSSTGTLTLPQGGVISETLTTNDALSILLTPYAGSGNNPDMAVKIYPTFNDDDHIHMVAGNPATVDLFLGDDDQYVKLERNNGNIVIGANADTHHWTFGTDGKLTLSTAGIVRSGTDTAQIGYQAVFTQDLYGNTATGLVSGMTIVDVGTNAQLLALIDPSSAFGNAQYNLLSPITITYSDATTQTFTEVRITSTSGSVIGFGYNATTVGHNFPITAQTANYVAATTAPEWTFSSTGTLTLPIGVSIDEYYGSHFPRIVADTGKAFSIQGLGSTGSLALQWIETESTSSRIAQVGLGSDNIGAGGTAKVILTAGATTADMKVWRFDETGKLTLPAGGVIEDSASYIKLTPAGGTSATQALLIYPTAVDGNHIHLAAPFNSGTELYLGNDSHYVKLVNTGSVEIRTLDGLGANPTWTFGNTGTLTVPGSIVPETNIAYDLGSPSNRFRDIYLSGNTINLGSATISVSATGNALELPVGTTTGGVSIGTIIILGSVADSTALTAISTATLTVGDSYVVASPAPAHLWTWNSTAFVDLGVFQGPMGDLGYTGSQGAGFTGSRGDTGYVGSQGVTGSLGYSGSRGFTGSSGFTGSRGVVGFTGSSGAGTTLTITSGTGIIVTTSGTIVTISATGSGSGYTGSGGSGLGYTGSGGSGSGYTGSIGFVGSRGYTGSSGSAGTQGVVGFTGSFGFIGSAGIGFVGSQGAAGTSGISWSISASGSSDYVFSGPGIVAENTNDPVLYLYRGFTYTFINTTGGTHPFAIRTSSTSGVDYTSGVSGSQTGTQTFTVPMNAPSTLYYICTIHGSMGNVINIV